MILALPSDTDLIPSVHTIDHPAAYILDHLWRHGAPVIMSTLPWSMARCNAAMERGSHLSARKHKAFLKQEMLQMVKKGQ